MPIESQFISVSCLAKGQKTPVSNQKKKNVVKKYKSSSGAPSPEFTLAHNRRELRERRVISYKV